MTMDKTQAYLNNFFDYDKWVNMYDPQSQETPDTYHSNSPQKMRSTLGNSRLLRQQSTNTTTDQN